ncbi:MAG: hypothetical protein HZB47_01070 [Nitrosomonadales bacterium]|nr:hypothetical protein [Nitrosomonadales bacterium]
MHILAAHYRSEFLATPQLIRFDYAEGREGAEPTFLVKASTLLLKYIVQGVQMQLAFSRLGDRLLYALKVIDDEEAPAILWSILERDDEKAALNALVQGEDCQVFLFNELAVNVAWTSFPIAAGTKLREIIAATATGPADHVALKSEASAVLDRFHSEATWDADMVVIDLPTTTVWQPIHNRFITSHASSNVVDIFNRDEGGQQEQLAIWLTDNLHPLGVHHGPEIPKGPGFRELTDVLLSYQYGSILIESKTLMVFERNPLPSRKKLAHDVSGHIKKAISQLRGGIRRLKDGTPVKSKAGVVLDIERLQPIHGIVLIPDLDLIQDQENYGSELIQEFLRDAGGFIHLLDIAELLRIVQAAEMIAARGTTTTPMMAFDYYLIERAKKSIKAGTLCIEVLLRIVDEEANES